MNQIKYHIGPINGRQTYYTYRSGQYSTTRKSFHKKKKHNFKINTFFALLGISKNVCVTLNKKVHMFVFY